MYERAISNYNKAIEINPEYVEAYNNRASTYADRGQYDLAISDYNKAIEINSKFAMAYYNRGNIYVEAKGQYALAISDYNKAIEINPEYSAAYNNRGLAYKEINQYEQAISDYNKAIEINPEYSAAYNNRGIIYYLKENMTKPGRMSIRHKIWVIKLTQDFLKLYVKLQEEKDELSQLVDYYGHLLTLW